MKKMLIRILIYLLLFSLANLLTQVMLEFYSLNGWQIEMAKFLIFMLLVFLHARHQKGKKWLDDKKVIQLGENSLPSPFMVDWPHFGTSYAGVAIAVGSFCRSWKTYSLVTSCFHSSDCFDKVEEYCGDLSHFHINCYWNSGNGKKIMLKYTYAG